MARQFVIQLVNRPGELAHVARALAERWIDITHIAEVGAGPTACAFLTTSDPDATRAVLDGIGMPYIEGQTIVADVVDEPGGLAAIAERLARAEVNILGTIVVGRRPGFVEMAFAVDDEEKARAALADASPTPVVA